jgi:DNA-binding winged helix-turn-helix (wHTH) protein
MTERSFYVFGPFHLDASGRLLLRDNEPVPLSPKAVDTLLVLVEHAGTVVSKDDLLRQVWQDAFVEEGSLTRAISVLRKALGDGEDSQKFIATISRRGSRFTAPVKVVANGAAEALIQVSRRRLIRWMLAGLAIFVIVAVLAVLNIRNLRARFRGDYPDRPH